MNKLCILNMFVVYVESMRPTWCICYEFDDDYESYMEGRMFYCELIEKTAAVECDMIMFGMDIRFFFVCFLS